MIFMICNFCISFLHIIFCNMQSMQFLILNRGLFTLTVKKINKNNLKVSMYYKEENNVKSRVNHTCWYFLSQIKSIKFSTKKPGEGTTLHWVKHSIFYMAINRVERDEKREGTTPPPRPILLLFFFPFRNMGFIQTGGGGRVSITQRSWLKMKVRGVPADRLLTLRSAEAGSFSSCSSAKGFPSIIPCQHLDLR